MFFHKKIRLRFFCKKYNPQPTFFQNPAKDTCRCSAIPPVFPLDSRRRGKRNSNPRQYRLLPASSPPASGILTWWHEAAGKWPLRPNTYWPPGHSSRECQCQSNSNLRSWGRLTGNVRLLPPGQKAYPLSCGRWLNERLNHQSEC